MRWEGRAESGNVEDRRGAGGLVAGGGILAVVGAIAAFIFSGDPSGLTNLIGGGGGGASNEVIAAQEPLKKFVSVVLKDTEDVWHDIFRSNGKTYQEPKLVLFSGQVQSGCGAADAGMGPFYCPPDNCVYIDLAFAEELRSKFRAPGDFALAYVVAHEVGHHVQNLLGHSDYVHQQRGRVSDAEYNQLSVRLELQADFLAGVFAHHAQRAKNILQPGDLEEALGAAAAVGDDRIQREARGRVVPDSFTHGTSEQRVRWFRRGFETGDLSRGDTFNVPYGQLD